MSGGNLVVVSFDYLAGRRLSILPEGRLRQGHTHATPEMPAMTQRSHRTGIRGMVDGGVVATSANGRQAAS
jgi:hypothetical protein